MLKFGFELHDVSATGDAGFDYWSATPLLCVTAGDDQRLAEARSPGEHEIRDIATRCNRLHHERKRFHMRAVVQIASKVRCGHVDQESMSPETRT